MATNPIPPLSFPTTPPMPAVARVLARYDRPRLAAFIAVAIDLLDLLGPDPEAEDNGDGEEDGTGEDIAYIEWVTKPANMRRNGQGEILPSYHEDDEEDDPDTCAAADDIGSGASLLHGSDGKPGDRGDGEPEDGI